jgi:hypothetical protein
MLLSDGFEEFEILKAGDVFVESPDLSYARGYYLIRFESLPFARRFLRRFRRNEWTIAALRRMLAEHFDAYAVSELNEDTIIEQLAAHLVSGRLKVRRRRSNYFSARAGGQSGQITPQPTRPDEQYSAAGGKFQTDPQARRPEEKLTWVAFKLRDMAGQPVPGMKYRVKLPGGAVEEGELDAYGEVEFDGIYPGTCRISFPDLDEEAWEEQQ